MRNFKYTVIGFFLFLLTIGFNVSIGILVYNSIQDKTPGVISIIILVLIIVSALVCTIVDVIRRKIMINRPLSEILDATKLMSRGNFNVRLIPNHSYENYDEFDHIKEDLNMMANELSKSEMLKNDFIANVSHEIKTPLAVIQSYANVLKDKSLDEETRNKYLDNLQIACKKLSNLVSNILKLNRLENKKLIPEITEFNLSELLITQILQFEEIIEKKDINLDCDIEEGLMVKSEQSYLEIVFNNLMSNAIKFTSNGGEIKVSLRKIDEHFIVKFIDTGCGMDNETGKHIFDKFYQGDTSHSKEGNGLGLALVKKVIDVIGGKINVESEVGKGTTFTISIKE